jgi:UDP-N-acetyl-D-mannosaminuronic acid dehydrogenase
MHLKKISMIGLGYIGLPTAAIMASRGLEVIGVDVNQQAVDTINQGKIHIVEPDLDIVVRSVVQTGQLRATTVPEGADAFLIAVPTPFQDGHTPDLSYIRAAAQAIAPELTRGNLVILESTSPVGTTEKLAEWLADCRPDLSFPQQDSKNSDILIAHCPERVLPGYVLQELVSNDRIIGGMTPRCAQAAMELYQTFVKGECLTTDARTAELSKLTENAYRDVNIAFANELSLICEELHVNAWEMIALANRHPRVNILQPGPGVGGHCIAVDPWFIVDSAPEQTRLIRTAREVNDSKPAHVLQKVKAKAERFKKAKVACLGLSFKANIDDLRESPALRIVEALAQEEAGDLLIVEPHLTALPENLTRYPQVALSNLNAVLDQADIVVGLVAHDFFRQIDQELLKEKIIIDCVLDDPVFISLLLTV